MPTSKALDSLNPKDAIEANAINFFNESCQALGILVDLNKKRLATCKKCGKTNKECFPMTIEEYDMYIEMLCENCLTEILDKKISEDMQVLKAKFNTKLQTQSKSVNY